MPARRRPSALQAVRVVEAAGSSSRSWDAAVADAVAGARDEAPRPVAVEVVRLWADLDARRRIRTYHAAVKVAYRQELRAPARPAAKRSGGRRGG